MTLILNLQYWEGDQVQAMALARLLADLEPIKRKDVTFLFSARFDAEFDEETIAHVSRKFNVLRFKGRKHHTGWPAGPNGLYRESHTHMIELTRGGKLNASGFFFMEADCVPLHKEWLNMLIAEWKGCGKRVLGAWLTRSDGASDHINGNCIIDSNLWRDCPELQLPGSLGWDVDLKVPLMTNGAPSRLIWSDYCLGRVGYNEWKGCDWLFADKQYYGVDNKLCGEVLKPVWFHGCKIMDGLECVRARLIESA
jgi:hypothetical protein